MVEQKRILVAEPDKAIGRLLIDFLGEGDGGLGFLVKTINLQRNLIETTQQYRPNLIVLASKPPADDQMTTEKVLALLSKEPINKIPVIILTEKPIPGKRDNLCSQPHKILNKPFDLDEMEQVVKELLQINSTT